MPIICGKSNYPILQLRKESDWQKLYDLCFGMLSDKAFCQIFDYLSGATKSILIEQNYIDKDYRDTYTNFYSKKFARFPSRALRLHFWKRFINKESRWKLQKYNDDYIGYIIIRPTIINPIGRSVLDPHKLDKVIDNAHLCLADYKVNLLGNELKVKGFPYISQDTDITICAHASCWMVFRYFSEKYTFYKEIWPYEITQKTKNISFGRLTPSKGLAISQVAEVFSGFGFFPVVYFKEAGKEDDFYSYLYSYIESGLPVVAGMFTERHAVTVIGHFSDYKKGINKSHDIIGTDWFVDGYLINDDNHMPYHALFSKKTSVGNIHSSKFLLSDIEGFVVPLYEKIYLQAEHARTMIREILRNPDVGLKAFLPGFKSKIILRTFLATSRSYKRYRQEHPMGNKKVERMLLQLPMPKFIWIGEISIPELYPEKTLGEIILDPTASTRDRLCFQWIHYPGHIITNDRNIFSDDPKRFEYKKISEDFNGYSNYEHNLKGVSL